MILNKGANMLFLEMVSGAYISILVKKIYMVKC